MAAANVAGIARIDRTNVKLIFAGTRFRRSLGKPVALAVKESTTMERSFKAEVDSLKLGNGQVFHGEGILADKVIE